jgi:hypothetical protein
VIPVIHQTLKDYQMPYSLVKPTMIKPTKSTRHIHEMANYSIKSGADVDWCSSTETFCISAKGKDDIFMQGDEAADVTREIEALCKRYPSLDEYTAALCIAKGYIDCLWA